MVDAIICAVGMLFFWMIMSKTASISKEITQRELQYFIDHSNDEVEAEDGDFQEALTKKEERFIEMLDRVFPDDAEDGNLNNKIAIELAKVFQEQVKFARLVEGNWDELVESNPDLAETVDENGAHITVKDFQKDFLMQCQKLINLGLADDRKKDDYQSLLSEAKEIIENMRTNLNLLARAANGQKITPDHKAIVKKDRDTFYANNRKALGQAADKWLSLIDDVPDLSGTASVFQNAAKNLDTIEILDLETKICKLVSDIEELSKARKSVKRPTDITAQLDIDSWQAVVSDMTKQTEIATTLVS